MTENINDIAQELKRLKLSSTRIEHEIEKKRTKVVKLRRSIDRDNARLYEIQQLKSSITAKSEVLSQIRSHKARDSKSDKIHINDVVEIKNHYTPFKRNLAKSRQTRATKVR